MMTKFFAPVKNYLAKSSFEGQWRSRNLDQMKAFMKGLNEPYQMFHNDVFCLNSKELHNKLLELEFVKIGETQRKQAKDELNSIHHYYYFNKEFNVVIRLIPSQTWKAISIALEILNVTNGNVPYPQQHVVFISTIRVLSDKFPEALIPQK